MIAGRHFGNARPDTLDDAGALMTEHDRLRHWQVLITHDDIGVANACCHDANQDFTLARLLQIEPFQRKRRMGRTRHRGMDFHCFPPPDNRLVNGPASRDCPQRPRL
jgi:hypothetical protein